MELKITMDDVIDSEDSEPGFRKRIDMEISHESPYELIAFELDFEICLRTIFGLLISVV